MLQQFSLANFNFDAMTEAEKNKKLLNLQTKVILTMLRFEMNKLDEMNQMTVSNALNILY